MQAIDVAESDIRKAMAMHDNVARHAAQELGMSQTTFRRHMLKLGLKAEGQVRPSRPAGKTLAEVFAGEDAPAADMPRGIDLTNRRVVDKKPPVTVKAKLYALKRGKGYPIGDAARDWGVSVETLRRHARDVDAVCFVEASPEEWIEVVTYPNRG